MTELNAEDNGKKEIEGLQCKDKFKTITLDE